MCHSFCVLHLASVFCFFGLRSLIKLGWLASKLQGPAYFSLPTATVKAQDIGLAYFHMASRNQVLKLAWPAAPFQWRQPQPLLSSCMTKVGTSDSGVFDMHFLHCHFCPRSSGLCRRNMQTLAWILKTRASAVFIEMYFVSGTNYIFKFLLCLLLTNFIFKCKIYTNF